MKTVKINTNLVFGIIALALALVLWFVIPSQIKVSTMVTEYVTGRFMPQAMAVIMGVCGLFNIIKGLTGTKDEKEVEFDVEIKKLLFIAAVIVYGLLARYVSFLLASLLFSAGILAFLGCKSWKKYLIVLVAVTAVVLAFRYGLEVRFGGIWGI